MDQVCFTTGEAITGIVGSVVMGVSALANVIKAPDEYTGIMKWVSRVVHFVSFDIVTAAKK